MGPPGNKQGREPVTNKQIQRLTPGSKVCTITGMRCTEEARIVWCTRDAPLAAKLPLLVVQRVYEPRFWLDIARLLLPHSDSELYDMLRV